MSPNPVSNNIRTLRFFHNEMSQKALADKVGVTRQTILAIENEKYSPSLELAFRIAHVFGTPLEEESSTKYGGGMITTKCRRSHSNTFVLATGVVQFS